MALLKSFANRPPRRAATEFNSLAGSPRFDSRTLLKPLFIAHLKNSRQAGLSNWVRDISVTLGAGSCVGASVLTYVIRYARGRPPMSPPLAVRGPSPRGRRRRSRKKNGRSHPAGGGAGSRVASGGNLCRAAQVGKAGLGSRGDGHARSLAPGGRGGPGGTAGRRGGVFPPRALSLRAGGALPRAAWEATVDRAGASRDRACVLRLPGLSPGTESARPATGCGRHGVYDGGAAAHGEGGQRDLL